MKNSEGAEKYHVAVIDDEAIKAGAFHYLTKPIRMVELRALVDKVMEKVITLSNHGWSQIGDDKYMYPQPLG
jgi:DNA-binding response OmpR family regulator